MILLGHLKKFMTLHDLMVTEKRIRESREVLVSKTVSGTEVIKFLDMKFRSIQDKNPVRSIIHSNVSIH